LAQFFVPQWGNFGLESASVPTTIPARFSDFPPMARAKSNGSPNSSTAAIGFEASTFATRRFPSAFGSVGKMNPLANVAPHPNSNSLSPHE